VATASLQQVAIDLKLLSVFFNAIGHEQTCAVQKRMSAFESKMDMTSYSALRN